MGYAKKSFWSLSVTAIVFVALYIFFVQASIFNLLSAREMSKELTKTSSELAVVETEYYNLSKTVNLQTALDQGFTKDVKVSFVDSHDGKTVTYLRGEERDKN